MIISGVHLDWLDLVYSLMATDFIWDKKKRFGVYLYNEPDLPSAQQEPHQAVLVALLGIKRRPRRGGVAPPTPPFLDLGDAKESAEEGGAEDAEQGAGTAELEPGRVESDALWQRAVNIAQPQLKGVRKNARQATALNAGNLHLLKQGLPRGVVETPLLGHLAGNCGPVHDLLASISWEDGLCFFDQVAVIRSQRQGDLPNLESERFRKNLSVRSNIEPSPTPFLSTLMRGPGTQASAAAAGATSATQDVDVINCPLSVFEYRQLPI
ncbi:hypothetical protein CGCF413_v012387 [Colletotrichum fructicola]|nr:hypothetical protein CGCF413_v012387 [Colletotrichum fructicola]